MRRHCNSDENWGLVPRLFALLAILFSLSACVIETPNISSYTLLPKNASVVEGDSLPRLVCADNMQGQRIELAHAPYNVLHLPFLSENNNVFAIQFDVEGCWFVWASSVKPSYFARNLTNAIVPPARFVHWSEYFGLSEYLLSNCFGIELPPRNCPDIQGPNLKELLAVTLFSSSLAYATDSENGLFERFIAVILFRDGALISFDAETASE